MSDIVLFTPQRVLTDNAEPGAGYLARFYQSGTTTPVTVYSDAAATVPLGQPLAANGEGVWPVVWVTGGSIKVVISDASDATVYTVDPCATVSFGGSAASAVSFSPTASLPYTNVQTAIEGAAASAATGFTPYGLGVTGSSALVANIDATNIASGSYRFDNTTTGTFPTGVAASDTGIVEMWRETAGSARMFMFPDTTDREFERRMNASAWGAWREVVHVDQGATAGDTIYRGASAWTRLPKGTAGQRLTMNSGATAPEWSPGDRPVLQVISIASPQATANLTAFDNTKYDFYEIVCQNLIPVTDDVQLMLRTSSNGGSSYDSTAGDYRWGSIFRSSGGANTNDNNNSDTAIRLCVTSAGNAVGSAAGESGWSGTIRIYGPGIAQKTIISADSTYQDAGGNLYAGSIGGARYANAAVTAARLLFSSGNIESGKITMYGGRNA